jgi:hypothetical protein
MRGGAKNRRRNKRSKGARRASATIDTLRAELTAARRVAERTGRHFDIVSKVADRGVKIEAELRERIAKLERVPRFIRWFFGAV